MKLATSVFKNKIKTYKRMIDREIIKYKNIVSIVAIVMLLLAIPSGVWAYSYYVLLRWVVFGAAIFVLYIAHERGKSFWLLVMGAIALLFNPIFPVYLEKEVWVLIDLIVAGIFLISIFKLKG